MALALYFHFFAVTSIITILGIIGFVLRDPQVRRNQVTFILLAGYLSSLVWIVLTYFNLVITLDQNPVLQAVIGAMGNFTALFTFFTLALFLRTLVSPKLDIAQITTFTVLISFTMGIRYASIDIIGEGLTELYLEVRDLTTLFNMAVLIYFLVSITIDFRKMITDNITDQQKLQIRLFYYPLLLSQTIGVVILGLVPIFGDNVLAFGFVTSTISNFLIAYSYNMDPRIVSVFKDKAYMILVANRHGTLKFSRNFYSGDSKQPVILSGIVTAIINLINDIYDFSLEPTSINFDNGFIQFGMFEKYFIIAFTEQESRLINNGIQDFAVEIDEKYGGKLEEVIFNTQLLDLGEEFNRAFYFLQNLTDELPPQEFSALWEASK